MALQTGNVLNDALRKAYGEERRDNEGTGAFMGGLESGAYGLRSSLNDLQAVGGRIVGADKWAEKQEQEADLYAAKAAGAGHMIPRWKDAEGVGGVADWAAGMLGQNVPLLGSMLATGGAGGLAAGTMAARGAAGLSAADKAAKIARATKIGQTAGQAAPYGTATVGATYAGLRNDPDAAGSERQQALGAAGSGALQAALGMAFNPLNVLQRFSKAPNLGAALATTVVGEGATEVGEQIIQQATQNLYNPEAGFDVDELIESGLGGMLVGGAFATPAAVAKAISDKYSSDGNRSTPPPDVRDTEPGKTHAEPAPQVREDTDPAENRMPGVLQARGWSEWQAEGEHVSSRTVEDMDGNTWNNIRDETTGDILEMPTDLQSREIYYRGQKIPAGRVMDAVLQTARIGEEADATALLEAANKAWFFRTKDVTRTVVKDTGLANDKLGRARKLDQMMEDDPGLKDVYNKLYQMRAGLEAAYKRGEVVPQEAIDKLHAREQAFREFEAQHVDTKITERGERLRMHPIWEAYGITPAIIEGTLDANTIGGLMRHMNRKGLVFAAKVDNQYFFAPPDQKEALFNDMGWSGQSPEKLGKILKREGGAEADHIINAVKLRREGKHAESLRALVSGINGERTYKLRTGEEVTSTVAQGGANLVNLGELAANAKIITNDDNNGTMYIADNADFVQGTMFRIVDDSGGLLFNNPSDEQVEELLSSGATGWHVELNKGIGRSTLTFSNVAVNADGSLKLTETGKEGQVVNSDMVMGKGADFNRAEQPAAVFPLNPPTRQKGGTASLSQALFSYRDAARAFTLDVARKGMRRVTDIMNKETAEKVAKGAPPGMLIRAEDVYNEIRKLSSPSSRGYMLASSDVKDGWVRLLPDSYKELNAEHRKLYNKDLEYGDELMIHRDPALPDATSQAIYRFEGVASLNGKNQPREGMVVNPQSRAWKTQGGDFDGDHAVTSVPDIEGYSRPKDHKPHSHNGFNREGPVAGLDAAVGYQYPTLTGRETEAQRYNALRNDPLRKYAIETASPFSTMIGQLGALSQQIAEMGLIDDVIPVLQMNPYTGQHTSETVKMTVGDALAMITQASISAKKHPVWEGQALKLFENIKDRVASKAKVPKFDANGKQARTKGKLEMHQAFQKLFGQLKRAPMTVPAWDHNTESKADIVELIYKQAQEVLAADAKGLYTGEYSQSIPVRGGKWMDEEYAGLTREQLKLFVLQAERVIPWYKLIKDAGLLTRARMPTAILNAAQPLARETQSERLRGIARERSKLRAEQSELEQALRGVEWNDAPKEARIAEISEEVSQINKHVDALYSSGQVNGAELLLSGMHRLALDLITVEDLAEITDNIVHSELNGQPMVYYEVDPATIADGSAPQVALSANVNLKNNEAPEGTFIAENGWYYQVDPDSIERDPVTREVTNPQAVKRTGKLLRMSQVGSTKGAEDVLAPLSSLWEGRRTMEFVYDRGRNTGANIQNYTVIPDTPELQGELQAAKYARAMNTDVNPVIREDTDPDVEEADIKNAEQLSEGVDVSRLNSVAQTLATLLGVSIPRVVNASELLRLYESGQLKADIPAYLKRKKLRGLYIPGTAGQAIIYVGSNTGGDTAHLGVFAHEFGHHVVETSLRTLQITNEKVFNAIQDAYNKFYDRKWPLERQKRAYEGNSKGLEFAEWQTWHRTDYLYNEWLADQIGRWITTNEVPKSALDLFFKGLADKIRELMTILRRAGLLPDASISKFLNGMAKVESTPEGLQTPDNQEAEGRLTSERQREYTLAAVSAWAANPSSLHDQSTLANLVEMLKGNMETMLAAEDYVALVRAVQQPDLKGRIWRLLDGNTEAQAEVNTDPLAAAAYAYVLAASGLLVMPPGPNGVLRKIVPSLRFILHDWALKDRLTPDQMSKLITGLKESAPSKPVLPLNSTAYHMYRERQGQKIKGLEGGIRKMINFYKDRVSWYVDVPYQRLMDTGNPVLIKLANLIQPMAWDVNGMKAAGSIELSNVEYHAASSRAAEIVSGLTEEQAKQVTALLYDKDAPATPAVREAANKLKGLLDDMYNYEVRAGLDVPYRDNYWPMVLNNDYVEENIDAVAELYTRTEGFKQGWERIKDNEISHIDKYYQAMVAAGELDAEGAQKKLDVATNAIKGMSVKEYASAYLTKKTQWTVQDAMEDSVHNPGFRFMNPRELNFLLQSKDPEVHGQVVATLDSNLGQVLNSYIKKAARRAEHQRVLGAMGGSFEVLAEQARKFGATDKEIQIASDYVDAVNGMLGIRERDAVDRIIEKNGQWAWLGRFHSEKRGVMNEKIQTTTSYALLYQMITKLTLSVFSAIPDTLGSLLLHGDGKKFAESMERTYKMMRNDLRTDRDRKRQAYLKATGAFDNYFANEDLMMTYHGMVLTPMAQKMSTWFFTMNGVEKVTEMARMMAATGAEQSFTAWKKEAGLPGEAGIEARRQLALYGLTADDILLDDQGDLLINTFEERAADPQRPESVANRERDNRVRAGIHRFINQSTVMPDPSNRPLAGSNPYYALMFQWKNFITAFDNQILRPAWQKLMEEGNATPLMYMALTFIPVMFFADMMRDAVKTAFDDDDEDGRPAWKRNWTLQDHLAYSVERAGFYGRAELLGDIIDPLMQGKIPKAMAEFAGPTGSDIEKISRKGLTEKNLPMADMWSEWN